MLLTPLSQTVTPSRTPSPLERDVLYGRPKRGNRAVEARSMLNQMNKKFTFCLEIFNDLLREMKSTSDSLQRTQRNISAACELINNARHYLQQKRTSDEFKEYFDAAKQLAV